MQYRQPQYYPRPPMQQPPRCFPPVAPFKPAPAPFIASEPTPPAAICNDIDMQPLAMCYVPWQRWDTVYDNAQALMYGTLFPNLNLRFTCGGTAR